MLKRVYTDFSVIDIIPRGLAAEDLVAGLAMAGLQRLTGLPLLAGDRRAAA